MNLRIKKAAAIGALTISMGTLALGVAGMNPALANEEQPAGAVVVDGNASGATSLSASTTTTRWCGWYLSGVDTELQLTAASNTYDGSRIVLSAEDSGLEVFVNGLQAFGDGSFSDYSSDEANCSWYGSSNIQEAHVRVTANNATFTGTADRGGSPDPTDTSMNFVLSDTDEALSLDVTEADVSCTSFGFDLTAATDIHSGSLTSTTVMSASDQAVGDDPVVGTNDRCVWSVGYATAIPAGKVPTYGGVLYVYTGPTLTTTLEIIGD